MSERVDAITQIVMSMFDVPFHLDQPVLSSQSPPHFCFLLKCVFISGVFARRVPQRKIEIVSNDIKVQSKSQMQR